MWRGDVAHVLVRAVSRPTHLDTLMARRQQLGAGRRQEWRRGTHECVRHNIVNERL